MRCYRLSPIPRSDSRFYTNRSFPILDPNPSPIIFSAYFPSKPVFSTRSFHSGLQVKAKAEEAKAKAKATINDEMVTEEAAELSFYELLGIPESGSFVEIKQAYKQLARKYHPDVSPPDRVQEYTKRFIRVQEAYATLSDPRSRALYDKDMAKGLHLAFSARRRYQTDEGLEEKSEWKNLWQSQLSELKRRSMNKDAGGGNMSWGARMRRRRDELANEL